MKTPDAEEVMASRFRIGITDTIWTKLSPSEEISDDERTLGSRSVPICAQHAEQGGKGCRWICKKKCHEVLYSSTEKVIGLISYAPGTGD